MRTAVILLLVLSLGLVTAPLDPDAAAAAGGLPVCTGTVATPAPSTEPATPAGTAAGTALTVVEDVPLPGSTSRFDYQSLDPTTGRLYIAHMGAGQVVVVDIANRTVVGTVDNLPKVTGVLAVPDLHRVYAAVAGDHQVAVIDDQTLTVIARLGDVGFPDGLDFDPGTGRVFVSDESGGGELVIDTATDEVEATIDLGGEAGNTHRDAGSGCILVAVQTRGELVAIDPGSLQVVGRYAQGAGCDGPHGFLIDAAHRLAFVTCEGNARLQIVDLATMAVTAGYDVGDGPDVLAFDPGLGRLYVASEAGLVSVFAEQGAVLQPVGEYRAPHAHTVAVDPATHLVYLPLEDVGGTPILRILQPAT
jgi:DNA-binding beta-propeller fold protein YncE